MVLSRKFPNMGNRRAPQRDDTGPVLINESGSPLREQQRPAQLVFGYMVVQRLLILVRVLSHLPDWVSL